MFWDGRCFWSSSSLRYACERMSHFFNTVKLYGLDFSFSNYDVVKLKDNESYHLKVSLLTVMFHQETVGISNPDCRVQFRFLQQSFTDLHSLSRIVFIQPSDRDRVRTPTTRTTRRNEWRDTTEADLHPHLRAWTNFLMRLILCWRSANLTSYCPMESFAFERHFAASVSASSAFS